MDVDVDKMDFVENIDPRLKATTAQEQVAIKAMVKAHGGGPMIITEDNFFFVKDGVKGKQTYWKCRSTYLSAKCLVRAVTYQLDGDRYIYVKTKHGHSHLANGPKATAAIEEKKMVERAVQNPVLKPRYLYQELVANKDLGKTERMALSNQVQTNIQTVFPVLFTVFNTQLD